MTGTDPRPDNRSPENRGVQRIAAARARRPVVDSNGKPVPGRAVPVFQYGTDGILESVTEEPTS